MVKAKNANEKPLIGKGKAHALIFTRSFLFSPQRRGERPYDEKPREWQNISPHKIIIICLVGCSDLSSNFALNSKNYLLEYEFQIFIYKTTKHATKRISYIPSAGASRMLRTGNELQHLNSVLLLLWNKIQANYEPFVTVMFNLDQGGTYQLNSGAMKSKNLKPLSPVAKR